MAQPYFTRKAHFTNPSGIDFTEKNRTKQMNSAIKTKPQSSKAIAVLKGAATECVRSDFNFEKRKVAANDMQSAATWWT